MIEEGIVFAPIGSPSVFMTVSGIPVFYIFVGDVVPFRTLSGIPGIWTVLGGDFDAYPAHTTNSIFILAALIIAVNDSLQHDSLASNDNVKSNSGVVNGMLR